ncbi:AMP-binding protein [Chachezhania sediminis]|uniref:AMP-binding protein n=1 Tax=Chachezhania sediminis TaxID=2599291 RepID=UPI00131E9F48|nr:AMP-binding protein [Chachezhania sediminis]
MTDPSTRPYRPFARRAPDIRIDRRADGTILIDAPTQGTCDIASIGEALRRNALALPDRIFLAERGPDGGWSELTYAGAWQQAANAAQWMLDAGLGQDTPLMILSGNSLAHAVITLAAHLVNVPVVPVSPPYALASPGCEKLLACARVVPPAAVFVEDAARFANALEKLDLPPALTIAVQPAGRAVALADVVATPATPAVDSALSAIRGDDVGKILFTSGSTGAPKAVINTQFNMVAVPFARKTVLAEPTHEILLDWLPWHHTFGGNAVLNGALYNGNTLYIDDGRPLPGQFAATVRNLVELRPTQFSSVPAAFDALAQALEGSEPLRQAFFSRVKLLTYGGAALGQKTHDRIQACAVATCGERIHFATGCGSTETTSMTTAVYWDMDRMGAIGLPLPGSTVKLVPEGNEYGLSVRGDQVAAGYVGQDGFLDDEGFFDTGDAVSWLTPDDPGQGLVFRGRLSENFKLLSGTWVRAGAVRVRLVSALAPHVQDAVIAGQDRDRATALVWLKPQYSRDDPEVRDALATALRAYNADAAGAAERIDRLAILTEPPSLQQGEITDKHYINQRAVLNHRAAAVSALYDDAGNPGLVLVSPRDQAS